MSEQADKAQSVGAAWTVWLVHGTVGEWSDRSEWTVAAYESEADAKAFVEMISAKGREAEPLLRDRWDNEEALDVLESEMRALDPSWSTYSSDPPAYTAYEIEVRPAQAALSRARGER